MGRHLVLSVAVLALFAAACGGAAAGDPCDKNGFLCASPNAALECKAGVWVSLPCRGPTGCARVVDTIKCDMTQNNAGDNCASTAEGKGLCNPIGTATLECRQGVLVQTNTCKTCSVSGDQVVCQ